MKILIAGATGQVGSHILQNLLLTEHEIIALVRQDNVLNANRRLTQVKFDFSDVVSYQNILNQYCPDILVIALGTTIKKAGSDEKFNQVDRDYPLRLIRALQNSPATSDQAKIIALVSSVGADRPQGLYLKAKYAVEQAVFQSNLNYIIARPSLLLSERTEHRPAEKFFQDYISKPYLTFAAMMPKQGAVWKYAPVHVREVAHAVVRNLTNFTGSKILEGKQLRAD
jgi:uncharacterized protein YbjT (DUF2867 family)